MQLATARRRTRVRNCRYEYVVLRYAFKQLIVPHLNMDLAKTVMDQKWLDDTDRRAQALRWLQDGPRARSRDGAERNPGGPIGLDMAALEALPSGRSVSTAFRTYARID